MKLERLRTVFTQECFLRGNLAELDLPTLTLGQLQQAAARGEPLRRADGVDILQAGDHCLGTPLAVEEMQKAIEGSRDSTLFVVFGLGMGHTARALRPLTSAKIIVYEPDVGLLRTVLSSGPQDLSDISIVCNPHDLANVWGRYSGQRRDAVIVNSPGYSKAFPDECAELPKLLRRLVERVSITKNTYRKRARTWVDDIIKNVELLSEWPPFLALENRYKNVPAFIIGAGPSLDQNVELLEEASKKGIVFATNSSAIVLGKKNIVPQVVACIESIDISERLATIPNLDKSIRAFSLSAHPNTLRACSGPLLPIYEAVPQYCLPLEELTGVPGVNVCGSVSTAAFSLAQKLGCSPIVLVGQDLAFTQGRTYAGGTGYESSSASFDTEKGRVNLNWNETVKKLHGKQHGARHQSEPLVETPAWGGQGHVQSGVSFMAINTWLEGMAALLEGSDSGTILINATEGGASVAGFKELTLKEVLNTLPEQDCSVERIVRDARKEYTLRSIGELTEWAQTQSQLTSKTRRQARRVRRLGRHALSAMRREEASGINLAFSALDHAEAALRKAVARVPLVDAWSHTAIDDLMLTKQEPEVDNLREKAQRAIALGTDVASAIEHSASELEQTLNNLATHLTQGQQTKGNLYAVDNPYKRTRDGGAEKPAEREPIVAD